jgi:hypothetical protein
MGTLQLISVVPFNCSNSVSSSSSCTSQSVLELDETIVQLGQSVTISRSNIIPLDEDVLIQFCSNGLLFDFVNALLDFAEWDDAGKQDYIWGQNIQALLFDSGKLDCWLSTALQNPLGRVVRNRRDLFTLLLCSELLGIENEYQTKGDMIECSDQLMQLMASIRQLERRSFREIKFAGATHSYDVTKSKYSFVRCSSRVGDAYQVPILPVLPTGFVSPSREKAPKFTASYSAVLNSCSSSSLGGIDLMGKFDAAVESMKLRSITAGRIALAPVDVGKYHHEAEPDIVRTLSKCVCLASVPADIDTDGFNSANFVETVQDKLPKFDFRELQMIIEQRGHKKSQSSTKSVSDASSPVPVEHVLVISRVRLDIDELNDRLTLRTFYPSLIVDGMYSNLGHEDARAHVVDDSESFEPKPLTSATSKHLVDICCVTNSAKIWWVPAQYCTSCHFDEDFVLETLHECNYSYHLALAKIQQYMQYLMPNNKAFQSYGIDAVRAGIRTDTVPLRSRKRSSLSENRISDGLLLDGEQSSNPSETARTGPGVVYPDDAVIRRHINEEESPGSLSKRKTRKDVTADVEKSTLIVSPSEMRENVDGSNTVAIKHEARPLKSPRIEDVPTDSPRFKPKREKQPNKLFSTYEMDISHVTWQKHFRKKTKRSDDGEAIVESTHVPDLSLTAESSKQDSDGTTVIGSPSNTTSSSRSNEKGPGSIQKGFQGARSFGTPIKDGNGSHCDKEFNQKEIVSINLDGVDAFDSGGLPGKPSVCDHRGRPKRLLNKNLTLPGMTSPCLRRQWSLFEYLSLVDVMKRYYKIFALIHCSDYVVADAEEMSGR